LIVEAKLQGTGDKVLRFIQEKPGCHLRRIKNELGISIGSVQYQLLRLENMQRVTSARQGSYKYYFAFGVFKDNEKNILQVLRQETAREILMFIIERKNPTQIDIVNSIGISAASVNWHIKHLIDFKIIERAKRGKYTIYQLSHSIDSKNIVTLLKNYYPSIWDKWSDRLAEMFLSLSRGKD
jgi:predicted transcriptional regulator